MTTAQNLLDLVRELVSDPAAAGISLRSTFSSTGPTVTPPAGTLTYDGKEDGSAFFTLPDGSKAITIDSWGSQARRGNLGIKRRTEQLGYPLITIASEDGRLPETTSLDWSHRHADATWRAVAPEATAAGIPFEEIRDAHIGDGDALLEHMPMSIVGGYWDSHTATGKEKALGKTADMTALAERLKGHGKASERRRASRILTSEIIATGAAPRARFAARVDALFGAVATDNASSYGLGSIPPQKAVKDVTFDTIEGSAFISLSYLRRWTFPTHGQDGQVVIALLALAAHLAANEDLHLRTGADLILETLTGTVSRHREGDTEFHIPTLDTVADALRIASANIGWAQRRVQVGDEIAGALMKVIDGE